MADRTTSVTLPEFGAMRGELLKVSAKPKYANDFYPVLQEQAGRTMRVEDVVTLFAHAVLEFAETIREPSLQELVELEQRSDDYLKVLVADPDAFEVARGLLAEQDIF